MINIILILLLVLFGYSLIPGRIPESWKNPVLVGLLFCAIATITCSFFFAKRKDAMFVSAEYPVSVGYMLGKQVRSDIKKRGEVVAVLSDKAKWASDRYLEGLQKALTGSSLNLLPPCLESTSEDTGALAPGVIEKVHKKNPNATAIVVFLSVPELRDEDKQAGLPPLYVFQRGEAATCKDWIEAGLVSGACFYKEDVNWEAAPARISSLEAAFKDRFKLATPGDLPPATQGTKQK